MRNWQKVLIAATGGILMGLTPDPFSLWILAWIAFNAIATCITDVDRDDKLISALSEAKNLDNEFKNLLKSDKQFKECVDQFRKTWPIANVLRIRQFERVASKSSHGKDLSKNLFEKVVM